MNIHSIAWKSILRLQQIYPQQVDEICTNDWSIKNTIVERKFNPTGRNIFKFFYGKQNLFLKMN